MDHIRIWEREFGRNYKYKGSPRDKDKIRKRSDLGSHVSRQEKVIQAILESDGSTVSVEDAENGIPLELILDPKYGLDAHYFEKKKLNIEVKLSTTLDDGRLRLILWIPKDNIYKFVELWKTLDPDPKAHGEQARRKALASVDEIRLALADALFVDGSDYFPLDNTTSTWWEIWLSPSRVQAAEIAAQRVGFTFKSNVAHFSDRSVCLVKATVDELYSSGLIGLLSELRKPQFSVGFLMNIDAGDAAAYQDAAIGRVKVSDTRVPVVLIDSGVNAGHPLINEAKGLREAVAMFQSDTSDNVNHGTGVASILLYGGELHRFIDGEVDEALIEIILDSVNAMQIDRTEPNPKLYGPATIRGCTALEQRDCKVFVSTITREDSSPHGAPDSYSSSIDLFTCGLDVNSTFPNKPTGYGKVLFIQSAGNVPYFDLNVPVDDDRNRLQSPAQSWNSLVVGAYTELPENRDGSEVFGSVAGGLSHYTTDGMGYSSKRPLLPDVVFEGGNTSIEFRQHNQIDQASILCANADFQRHPLGVLWGTSAAAALAGRFCARLSKRYPAYWPETIRALVVQSARWTEPMLSLVNNTSSKTEMAVLTQRCGFGTPDFDIASDSTPHRVTLVREAEIQPFKKTSSSVTLNELHLIELPWPELGLREISKSSPGDQIELRVTLSYFVEPNPSTRDLLSRYKYESFGLRWRFQKPNESVDELYAAVSADTDVDALGEDSLSWAIGTQARHRGSIHSDIWKGSAAELATMKHILIYPVSGWWKTRPSANRYDDLARYSLVVSLDSPSTSVDLYQEVKTKVTVTPSVTL